MYFPIPHFEPQPEKMTMGGNEPNGYKPYSRSDNLKSALLLKRGSGSAQDDLVQGAAPEANLPPAPLPQRRLGLGLRYFVLWLF